VITPPPLPLSEGKVVGAGVDVGAGSNGFATGAIVSVGGMLSVGARVFAGAVVAVGISAVTVGGILVGACAIVVGVTDISAVEQPAANNITKNRTAKRTRWRANLCNIESLKWIVWSRVEERQL